MRRVVTLGSLSAAGVLLSFGFQWYVLTVLGPGRDTDALFAGMVVPQMVLGVITGSLNSVLVPLLSAADPDESRRDAWMFFLGIGALFGGLAAFLITAAPLWVPIIVPGFDPATVTLTIHLVRIQLVGMVFTALAGVLWSIHYAHQRFVLAEVAPVLASLVGVLVLVLGLSEFGIVAAAWALVVRMGFQTLVLLPGLGPYVQPNWKSEGARAAWRKLRPLLLGTMYYKTDQLVDRFLASMAPVGVLSLLHLAFQLYGAGHQVLTTAIVSPAVPALAQSAHRHEWNIFQRLSRSRELWMAISSGVVFVGIVLVGQPTLSLVFGHGRFSSDEIQTLWWILIALGGTWAGGAIGNVLASSFYATGNTVTPTRIGVAGFTLGIVFKVLGFYQLGVFGIAAGTSLYVLLNAVLMHWFLSKQIDQARLCVTPEKTASLETVQ